DRGHRPPRRPQQLRHGGGRRVRGQPRASVFELTGEPRPGGSCPRHRRDHHPMLTTAHPRGISLQPHPHPAEVQAPHPPPPIALIPPRSPPTAPRTPRPGRTVRPDPHHQHRPGPSLFYLNRLHHRVLDPDQHPN